MPESPDPVREAFGPLRRPISATDGEVARVRAAAGRARRPRPRRRLAVGLGAATVIAASAAAITLVDRGHPGTFVGEAGARELLRAAADAARDDPAPRGWRLRTTTRVRREAFEGRRCSGCRVERAVLETTSEERLWSGPRGETYTSRSAGRPRALENAPLLEYVGALEPPPGPGAFPGEHVVAAAPGTAGGDLVGRPGTIADPSAVPRRAGPLLRWAARQQRESWEEQKRQAARRGGGIGSAISMSTRISYGLIDLSTAPELAGAQRAAAFEALADRPGVTAVPAPALFASPGRVAVRIAASSGDGGQEEFRMMPVADRVIVFDRSTHRVVAEAAQPTREDPRASFEFGSGKRRKSLRMVAGGGGETRYGTPVDVPGPGLDAHGHRLLDLDRVLDSNRDGTLSPAAEKRLVGSARAAARREAARGK
jgi:hypothetical protein